MKDLDNATRQPCSVSQELVDAVAAEQPHKFYDANGNLQLHKVLFSLGFKIDLEMFNKGVYVTKDAWVRDNELPHRAFKTTVYNGTVRKLTTVDPVTKKRHYTKRIHPMNTTYEKFEVVNPDNLDLYVAEHRFSDIYDLGSKDYYDKGFAAMDRPSDNVRNIVRN